MKDFTEVDDDEIPARFGFKEQRTTGTNSCS